MVVVHLLSVALRSWLTLGCRLEIASPGGLCGGRLVVFLDLLAFYNLDVFASVVAHMVLGVANTLHKVLFFQFAQYL